MDKDTWLKAEKVRMIYGLIPNDISGAFIVSILISALLWDVIPKIKILLWFLLVMFGEFLLYLLGKNFRKNSSLHPPDIWENRFVNLLFFQGILFGFLGIFLFPDNSIAHQSFIAAFIGGIITGVIGFYAVSMKVVISFVTPIILPFTIRVLSIGDRFHIIMGITLISYTFIMFFIAKRMNVITLNSLSLNYELSKAKENLEEEVQKATYSLRKSLDEEKRLKTEKEIMLRDLHDGIGGIITNINLITEMAKNSSSLEYIKNSTLKVAELSKEGITEIRSFMQSLDEKEITWDSLDSELRNIGNTVMEPYNIEFKMESTIQDPSSSPGSFFYLNLLRIYKEALTNIVKHSKAKSVILNINISNNQFRFYISDDGIGIIKNNTEGRGIQNMKKRVREMGGNIIISSNQGTHIEIKIPLMNRYRNQKIHES